MLLLHVAALIAVIFSIAFTVEYLLRAQRREAAMLGLRCGACGTDGSQAQTFACPGCGYDLRTTGLAGKEPKAALYRTCRVSVIAAICLLAYAFVPQKSPRHSPEDFYRYSSSSFNFNSGFAGLDGVMLIWESQPGSKPADADLLADLYSYDGRLSALHVSGASSMATVRRATGEIVAGPSPLNAQIVGAWINAAGADPDAFTLGPLVQRLLTTIRGSHDEFIAIATWTGGRIPRVSAEIDPALRIIPLSGGGGAGGGHPDVFAPGRHAAIELIAGSMLWIVIFLIVMIRSRSPRTVGAKSSNSPFRPVVEPVCGRCRYSVVGLDRLQCPECGEDLRRVGIVPNERSGAYREIALAICTFSLAALFLGAALIPRLAQLLPTFEDLMITRTISRFDKLRYQQLVVSASDKSIMSAPRNLPVTLELTLNSGKTATLNIDIEADRARYTDPQTGATVETAFTYEAIRNWMLRQGVQATAEELDSEAKAEAILAQQQARTLFHQSELERVNGHWKVTRGETRERLPRVSLSAVFTAWKMFERAPFYGMCVFWLAGVFLIYRAGTRRPLPPREPNPSPQPDDSGEATEQPADQH